MDSDVHLTCGNGLVNAMNSLKLFEQVQFVKDSCVYHENNKISMTFLICFKQCV